MQSLPCSLLLLFTLHAFIIFLSVPSSALPSCSPPDLASLQAFQSSLSTSLPWSNHTNCCLWLGVRCDAHGRVVSLHLPSSNLSGLISPHLFQLSALHSLNLFNNSLHGIIAPDIANLSMLAHLDLSRNPFLTSPVPLQLPSRLQYLDLSHCAFYGSIIINASSLQEVFIGGNLFTSFASASMEALQTFNAPRNFFSTSILQTLQNCTNLHVLNLDHNYVGGVIPSEIGMLSKLEVMRLQGNRIMGFIPQEIGDCKQMREIWLDDNHLTGILPKEVGKLSLLTHLSLANNRLFGLVPDAIVGCAQLSHLSLSGNMFTGKIPAALGGLPNLQVLLMANNKFSGSMPQEIGRLRQLRILDIAGNRVEGSISSGGIVDAHIHMIRYDKSPVHGLSSCCDGIRSECACSGKWWWPWTFLNGAYLKPSEDVRRAELHHHHPHGRLLQNTDGQSKGMKPLLTGVICGVAVFCGIVLLAVVVAVCKWKINPWRRMRRAPKPPPRLSSLRRFRGGSSQVFDPSLTSISMRDLIKATSGFSPERVVGDGGFGLVYHATLCDGRSVAVKKLATDGIQGKREFQAELETLGRIKHRNLVELLAYCEVGEDRALVYEFMEHGSLDTWLHERDDGPRRLDWKMRLHISIGAARGLAYLHHSCNPLVIHRDIKSSNILLGKDFEARIADFGLARHMSPCFSHVSTDVAGTLGYMAPEYYLTLFATTKADVYSFGMLMLELASRRRPDAVLEGKTFKSLNTWVEHVVDCGLEMDLLDPVLKEQPPPHDQVRGYITLAHACISQLPEDRPTMKCVYTRLSALEVQRVDGESVDKSIELQSGGMESIE